MDKRCNYNMAVALLRFKVAYKDLVQASINLPDYDISDGYPFYLLDFEGIEPAVLQWCTIHASRLMRDLPDRVDNPACLKCPHLRSGLSADGQCKGFKETWCNVYPVIPFSREAVLPVLIAAGTDVSGLRDEDVHLLYIKRTDEVYAQTKENASDATNHDDPSVCKQYNSGI